MPAGKTVLFVKHMAKQMFFDQDHSFIFDKEAINVLLLRDPVEQLVRFMQCIHNSKYSSTKSIYFEIVFGSLKSVFISLSDVVASDKV